jgi:ribulose-5-phosphate 4-epimerase/fuculose-1-phosphate aldolase
MATTTVRPATPVGEPIPDAPELRRELIEVMRRALAMGLVQYTEGNFSARIPGTPYALIKPSARPYDTMRPEDLATVDLDGNHVAGPYAPSSETPIHTLAYRRHPSVGGCVHIEPPYTNALYAVGTAIPNVLGNLVYLFGGKGLAVGPSSQSGSATFAAETLDAMGDHFGVVWKNHGIFCVGQTLELAFRRCWATEQAAHVYHLALALRRGEPDLVPADVQAGMVEAGRAHGWGRSI